MEVRVHYGLHVDGGPNWFSLSTQDEHVDHLKVKPRGVLVVFDDGSRRIIPNGNIHYIERVPEEDAQ